MKKKFSNLHNSENDVLRNDYFWMGSKWGIDVARLGSSNKIRLQTSFDITGSLFISFFAVTCQLYTDNSQLAARQIDKFRLWKSVLLKSEEKTKLKMAKLRPKVSQMRKMTKRILFFLLKLRRESLLGLENNSRWKLFILQSEFLVHSNVFKNNVLSVLLFLYMILLKFKLNLITRSVVIHVLGQTLNIKYNILFQSCLGSVSRSFYVEFARFYVDLASRNSAFLCVLGIPLSMPRRLYENVRCLFHTVSPAWKRSMKKWGGKIPWILSFHPFNLWNLSFLVMNLTDYWKIHRWINRWETWTYSHLFKRDRYW